MNSELCETTFYVTIESENEIQSNEKQKGWRQNAKHWRYSLGKHEVKQSLVCSAHVNP